jgi:hypothetical protein
LFIIELLFMTKLRAHPHRKTAPGHLPSQENPRRDRDGSMTMGTARFGFNGRLTACRAHCAT